MYLSNRAASHLSSPGRATEPGQQQQQQQQAGCELEMLGRGGGWVNQAYSGSTPSLPRAVSTVYSPQQSLFHSSMDSVCSLGIPGGMGSPYPPHNAAITADPKGSAKSGAEKKKSSGGCCSCLSRAIKGTSKGWGSYLSYG